MSTIQQIETTFVQALSTRYDRDEALAIFFWTAEEILKKNRSSLQLHKEDEVSSEQADAFSTYLKSLCEGKPVQYVLGYSWFLNKRFKVTPDVLIPRPETEELILLIEKLTSFPNPRILDIGTGSGCIPITLYQKMPRAEIWAWDVSAEALQVAQTNAHIHQVAVHFQQMDILKEPLPLEQTFDIIVSNPPYILSSEKPDMAAHVVAFEPSIALFVPDEDPLLFYRAIAKFALATLAPNGWLFFEINQRYGEAVLKMMQFLGYKDVKLHTDIHGNNRMISIKNI